GRYTAPGKTGTFTVIATSVADPAVQATAEVTVGTIAIALTPATATATQGGTVQFSATVTGTSNTAVTWSVEGGDANGTISSTGRYTAPGKTGTFTVIATSVADPAVQATATVTVPAAQGGGYTDPTTTGWRLVKNTTASSGSHLVLDLVGPTGQSGRGVSLTLSVDPTRAYWTKVAEADTELVTNRLFTLGAAPQLLKGASRADGTLNVGVFHKGTGGTATPYSGALISVALDVKSGPSVPAGSRIPLSFVKGQILTATGDLRNITVAVGTLTAE
ncbi:MAG: hypothetical protein ABW123_04560, partial [Cystobacter sp.]